MAGQPAGLPGGDRGAGRQVGDAGGGGVGDQLVVVDEDGDGGGLPPWRGRSAVRTRSRRATNPMPRCRSSGRLASSSVDGVLVESAGWPRRGAVKAARKVRSMPAAWSGIRSCPRRPVAAGAQAQPGDRDGAAFRLQQPLVLGLVGDVGGQELQQPGPIDPELAQAEVVGLVEDQPLRLLESLGAEVGGEGVEGLGDHPHLGQVHPARRERRLHLGPGGVELLGQRHLAAYRPVRVAGLVGQPGRGRAGAR